MKDEGYHQGAVDKSFSEQQIRIVDANYILCEKNWTHTRSGNRFYGRQAGRQAGGRRNTGEFGIFLKITVHRKIQLFASFNQGTASLQQ